MAQKITFKLRRILLFRVFLLAILAFFAVIVSSVVLKQFLIKSALTKEAEYFWNRYAQNEASIPPDTWNLKTLLIDGGKTIGSVGQIETTLFDMKEDGFIELPDEEAYTLIHKSTQGDKQLFLLFNGENVQKLAFFLGIIPLLLFLFLSYLIGFFFYRRAAKTLSPIVWLADKFDQFDPLNKDLPEFNLVDMPKDADWETSILATSLEDYLTRIKRFVNRERAFTRDVSHELRTPLTVMSMALSILNTDKSMSEQDVKTIQRIRNANKDMRELVDVFLILARESSAELEKSEVWVPELIEMIVDKNKLLLAEKPIDLTVHKEKNLVLETSEKIVEVLLGNLIRNAMIYTEHGAIDIVINQDNVVIKDTGVGMSDEQVAQIYKPFFRGGKRPSGGHGVGLTIVKRIADRFDWQVDFKSELNVGTQVTVTFK